MLFLLPEHRLRICWPVPHFLVAHRCIGASIQYYLKRNWGHLWLWKYITFSHLSLVEYGNLPNFYATTVTVHSLIYSEIIFCGLRTVKMWRNVRIAECNFSQIQYKALLWRDWEVLDDKTSKNCLGKVWKDLNRMLLDKFQFTNEMEEGANRECPGKE